MAKILVVDDRVTERGLLVTLLKYALHDVLEAAHGAQALQIVKAEYPDLVISDVLLPEMDGYEFVRQLRADPSTARTPVIFYTAVFNEHEAKGLAKDCGVSRVLSKPTEPAKILEVVSEVLRARGTEVISPLPPQFKDKHQQLLIDKLLQQVEALRQSEEKLREAHVELEKRVEERTAELAEANAKLKAYASRLEAANQELQEFAFVASHDLQEPLRKIQTFGDLICAKYEALLDEPGRDYLARVRSAAVRMSALLDALLSYSRVTSRITPFMPTDLTLCAREAASDLEVLISRTGGIVEIGKLPIAEVDPAQLRQLFQNLMANALKYKGDKTPRVKVYGESCLNGAFRIIVEDNGIGFDEQYLPKIFQPFQRLHGRNSPYAGTGMGLAICRKIAERHGGSITARSAPGKGSAFIVTLPRKQEKPPDGTPVTDCQ